MKICCSSWRSFATFAALAAALAISPLARAETDYEATFGVGNSDNITRVETLEQEDTAASAGLRFSMDKVGPRLRADFIGDLAYVEYLEDTFDSELLGNVRGTLQYAFVPERFDWLLEENFGQVMVDPLEPATPENRENINYISTGPEVTLPLGTQSSVRVSGRYSLTTYEDSPFDSSSVLGELAFVRDTSSSSSMSLHGRLQQVAYDEETLDADYEQTELFGRYEARGIRTHVEIDAGYSQLERDVDAETLDSPLLRISLERRLSGAMTATLAASREFSNSGAAFALGSGGGIGLDTAPGRQTAEPFTQDRISLGWNYARNRTSIGISAAWDDRAYEQSTALDQTLTAFFVEARRELSSRMSLSAGAGYSIGEFSDASDRYDDLSARLGLDRYMSRASRLSLSYEYFKRDSDLAGAGYTENRIWLSFIYGNGRPRETLIESQPPELQNP